MDSRKTGLLALILATLTIAPALAASTQISGEFVPQDRTLKWQMTNTGHSPIVRIEIPHFHADSVELPEGWESKSTHLVTASVPSEPGVCIFTSKQPSSAISPGSTKGFSQHFSLAPFEIGKGSVVVYYADGTSEKIPNVSVSVAPTQSGMGIVGIIVAGIVLILYAMRRNRKTGKTMSPPAQDDVV